MKNRNNYFPFSFLNNIDSKFNVIQSAIYFEALSSNLSSIVF